MLKLDGCTADTDRTRRGVRAQGVHTDLGVRQLRRSGRIDADGAARLVTTGIDGGVLRLDRSTGNIDRASGQAFLDAAGIDGAAHRDVARRAAAQEDPAIALRQRCGPDDAAIVDDARLQETLTFCREEDGASFRDDDALVRDQGLQHVAGDGDVEQTVAVQRKGRRLGYREGDPAEIGLQAARVDDLARGIQEDEASVLGAEMALVHDRAIALVRETPFSCGVAAGVAGRRGDQPGHVDLRILAEQDAVGIQEEDLAVGLQASEDLGSVIADDAVDRDGLAVRLDELHGVTRADVEALPVHPQGLGALGDRHRVRGCGDAPGALGHLTTLRERGGTSGDTRGQQARGGEQGRHTEAGLATPGGGDDGCFLGVHGIRGVGHVFVGFYF